MSGKDNALRLPLLKTLNDLARSGMTVDASIVTTYAFNGLFYEEVLLRAFERAGSRLNIVLADEPRWDRLPSGANPAHRGFPPEVCRAVVGASAAPSDRQPQCHGCRILAQ